MGPYLVSTLKHFGMQLPRSSHWFFARVIVFSMVLLSGAYTCPLAWAGDVDTQLWLPVQLKIPLTEKVSLKYLAAPLWQEGPSRPSRWALRQGAHYQLTPRWEAGVTMDYQPTLRPNPRDEWRLGQQIAYSRAFKAMTWQHRSRLEQRWIEDSAFRHRLRLRNRLARPLPSHPSWYGFVEQELHLNIGKEQTGFDQHRLYTGIGKKFSRYCSVEGGYQWIYANTSASNNEQHLHMALIQILLQTPHLFKKPSSTTPASPSLEVEEPPDSTLNSSTPLNDY